MKTSGIKKEPGIDTRRTGRGIVCFQNCYFKMGIKKRISKHRFIERNIKIFAVSIDDLLSGEQLITIAEKENRSNLNTICDLLLGFVDLFSLMLIFLPLYPKPVNGYIYAVNLFDYVDNDVLIITIYWALFIGLTIVGIVKILMVYFKLEKGKRVVNSLSVGFSVFAVLFLAMVREPYAIVVAFLLLLAKGGLLYKQTKAG